MSYPPPGQPAPQPGWSPPPPQYGFGAPPPVYGAPAYGAPPSIPGLAGYGKRIVAYLIDSVVVLPFVAIGIIIIFTGEREIVPCSDGFGLCEEPTDAVFATGFLVMALTIPVWFAYHAWEGATGKTLGKLAMGIRLVDERTMAPVGGWKGIGRGLVEGLLGFLCSLGSLLDVLWPLWDDKNQTIHDKAVGGVVVEAAYLRPKGNAPTSDFYGTAPAYQAPPPAPYGAAPPTAPGPPQAPGAPGSPTDPFGSPPPSAPPPY